MGFDNDGILTWPPLAPPAEDLPPEKFPGSPLCPTCERPRIEFPRRASQKLEESYRSSLQTGDMTHFICESYNKRAMKTDIPHTLV